MSHDIDELLSAYREDARRARSFGERAGVFFAGAMFGFMACPFMVAAFIALGLTP